MVPLIKKISLSVAGQEYTNWTETFVARALDQASSEFQLTLADDPNNNMQISAGKEVKVKYGSDVLMSGYIDRIEVSYGPNEHTIVVSGRSKTKDIIDSSCKPPYQYKKQTAEQIIKKVAANHNVGVVIDGQLDPKVIETFAIEKDGETAFEVIQRLAETSGMVISDTTDGKLWLTRAASRSSSNNIVKRKNEPTNILTGSLSLDESDTYKKIIVKGQSRGTDEVYGKAIDQIIGEAEDKSQKRERILIIVADRAETKEDCQEKANWEQTSRLAKSLEVNYTMVGFYGSGNQLWDINNLVSVYDDILQIQTQLLISRVEYRVSNSGTICGLRLAHKDAFKVAPGDSGEDIAASKKKKAKLPANPRSDWGFSDTQRYVQENLP